MLIAAQDLKGWGTGVESIMPLVGTKVVLMLYVGGELRCAPRGEVDGSSG
ncbi:MAG: hypothetical protein ACI9XZ_002319 [Alphaproteobacteria bacterium]|jgi:hypothetical protein